MSTLSAEEALAMMTRARRRVTPRVAPALYDAQDMLVETPFGPVQAWRLGEGPAVLLVHGWEDDNALWGPLIDLCAGIGRAIVVLDLPGHGVSPAEEATIASARAGVRAVAEAFQPIDALVAHSFGCPASTAAMHDGLHIERVVLIASPLPDEKLARRRWADEIPPEIFDAAAALYQERTGRRFHDFDYLEAAAAMRAEALMVHSLDDEKCPPENAQRLADRWPRAQTLITDGLGHRLIAQDPEILTQVLAFVGA